MHVEISIDFEQQRSRGAGNQGHDKRGEICMPLITCGSIHEGHEWFSDYSRRRQELYMCLAVLLCSNFADSQTEVPRYRSSQSYLMRSFFFVSVFLAAVKCYTKLLPFGVNCRLQLAGLGKKREETVKPTCFNLLYVESDFGTTDTTD